MSTSAPATETTNAKLERFGQALNTLPYCDRGFLIYLAARDNSISCTERSNTPVKYNPTLPMSNRALIEISQSLDDETFIELAEEGSALADIAGDDAYRGGNFHAIRYAAIPDYNHANVYGIISPRDGDVRLLHSAADYEASLASSRSNGYMCMPDELRFVNNLRFSEGAVDIVGYRFMRDFFRQRSITLASEVLLDGASPQVDNITVIMACIDQYLYLSVTVLNGKVISRMPVELKE